MLPTNRPADDLDLAVYLQDPACISGCPAGRMRAILRASSLVRVVSQTKIKNIKHDARLG